VSLISGVEPSPPGQRAARPAIAVDHQPRVARRDQRRIEDVRQLERSVEPADVPADMARQLLFGDAEIAQRLRHRLARVIAQQ
jgi:hypothetical protein